MNVQQNIASLLQLQELDLKTHDIRNELLEIPKNHEEIRSNVEAMAVLLQKERDRLAEAEQWRTSKEDEISLQNDLLAKSKGKLQESRNEKESKAAQREIDVIKKNIADQEKELLELMEAIEQYRKAQSEHEAEFCELEEHLAMSETDGRKRADEIRDSLGTTDDARTQLADKVNPRFLRLYERIRKKHPNPVVTVKAPICPGCNFQIRPQEFNDLIRGERLINCQSCMRIFVYGGEDVGGAEVERSSAESGARQQDA